MLTGEESASLAVELQGSTTGCMAWKCHVYVVVKIQDASVLTTAQYTLLLLTINTASHPPCSSHTDLARKQAILQQYKAEFDAHATEAATAYTTALAPALLAVLRDGPGNDADADHAVRKASLELLARLKPDEQLKPLAVEILRTCLHVC